MKKILIIDDDMTFQLTMSTKLKQAGYEAISALDGEKGLDMALHQDPDLILLDIKMPKMDGLELLRAFCADKTSDKKVPIFITSNISGLDEISEGVNLGIKGYIVKSDESLDTILTAVNGELAKKVEEPS